MITHTISDILRARVFAIACGYPDADDLDDLRKDPAFKLACGRLPESGIELTSQPSVSRWENAPDLRTLIRLARSMVDLWCNSYPRAPKAITLDIDDTSAFRSRAVNETPDGRHRAWPSAIVAVQRALRRTLLSADPCL